MISRRIDYAGSAASLLCVVHCATTPFLLPFLSLAAARWAGPALEWGFLASALGLGAASLGHSYCCVHHDRRALACFAQGITLMVGIRLHEPRELGELTGVTVAAALMIRAHLLNLRLRRQATSAVCECARQDHELTVRRP